MNKNKPPRSDEEEALVFVQLWRLAGSSTLQNALWDELKQEVEDRLGDGRADHIEALAWLNIHGTSTPSRVV